MGQKVSPIGLRIGINKTWESKWFADNKNFSKYLNNDVKIDVEYDGWYWHQDKKKDKKRDYYHMRRGWKILRVKSGTKLPSFDALFKALDYLINTDHHHCEIILDDWKDVAI